MSSYVVRIHQRTLHTALHSPACRMVQGKQCPYGLEHVEAETPEAAIEKFMRDEQVVERGLPRTTICPCVTR